ncbi:MULTISPECIES: UDP-N-acetylmuramoyl-tripeptide--D-alanyl-D-alanine ligase [Aneurinibacillus]|uniref:UDP-N-acetylmuramoyl-tripeptide--D-alanyl-D-alanine ligase n=1 Tax=Aneurinibacillus thermoaerophilus TaxID=143495 RepID=A0A1G8EUZ6_ANETH|nr:MULTISPECIES: UDP-N-acetylmuramoyl-tripeptide--D-alanyl-D-alanine ligase [Aneurinibacillus]AMA73357.1 Mur ligase [Aneurinibacillus sp. XH2]MED0676015.1 UDP-N-acetylmuramoyl-tripeptide--D-alanyl-D-alanine ligase [Aneurinibacillus thermoaerophilus]MED0680561.1 UDP-N-acetylmuramoyl-tripeptide--D-alanyl-D-alanine ligase [Aneurinibacillus thermoaerophilus]MED0736298.1 UDP-N-acetylmuramoyl-tripeptide--D-alanyl-D-alanine ligase [Aneurinibacillus thermoaerophilus]MED0763267.1 UDP-N-acetylmuramoyl-t
MPKTLILTKPIIAVTGSAGKTTTKEMIASVLRRRWRIFASYRSFNQHTCSARNAKRIRPFHRAAVLEFGMGARGQIKKHCKFIQPNMGVITNVGTAHIGNVGGNVEGIAKAKSELIKHMKQTGYLVLNADDPNSKLLETEGFQGTIVRIGIKNEADFRAKNVGYETDGMSFDVLLDGQVHTFYIPIYGEHNVYNALNAIAIASRLGFTPEEMKTGLRYYKRTPRRLNIFRYTGNITLIDDSCSANPNAVRAALDVLKKVSGETKVAVLGTMLAMGKYSTKAHMEVGRYVASTGVDYLYTYGKRARHIALAAIQAGFSKERVKMFESEQLLRKSIVACLKPNTTILIKASHKIGLEKTVDYIKKQARLKGLKQLSWKGR